MSEWGSWSADHLSTVINSNLLIIHLNPRFISLMLLIYHPAYWKDCLLCECVCTSACVSVHVLMSACVFMWVSAQNQREIKHIQISPVLQHDAAKDFFFFFLLKWHKGVNKDAYLKWNMIRKWLLLLNNFWTQSVKLCCAVSAHFLVRKMILPLIRARVQLSLQWRCIAGN